MFVAHLRVQVAPARTRAPYLSVCSSGGICLCNLANLLLETLSFSIYLDLATMCFVFAVEYIACVVFHGKKGGE